MSYLIYFLILQNTLFDILYHCISFHYFSFSNFDKSLPKFLSDILFNHYDLNSFGAVTSFHEDIGCDCIQFEYPKIIFLFKKNGKFEKYMALPDNGLNRYNFSNDEWNYIDWSMEKENMILKMFKKDILPDENCKGKVYTPPPSPNK